MPVSEAEFQRRVGNGSVAVEKMDRQGRIHTANNLVNYGSSIWIDNWTLTYSTSNTDFTMNVNPDGSVSVPTDENGQPTGPVPTVTIGATGSGYFITSADGLELATQLVQAPANPQNPTSPEDFRRDTFNKLQADINRCIGEIFGKTAAKIPTQTLDLAPDLDVTVNGRDLAKRSDLAGKVRSVIAIPDPSKGRNGTVFIQSGAWNLADYPRDVLEGAYIHEYGNLLSYKYGGKNYYKFGDKAGVGEKKDRDTGANFQRCVYPSSVKF